MKDIILPDTSLAAIVRDEKMNPAGGIIRFLDSIVPYVKEAVIVDTGSKDGTRGLLEEAKKKYNNLRVYDRQFDGYASSRNYSLEQVKTKRVLVLDADELLTKEDLKELKRVLIKDYMLSLFKDTLGYNFNFLNILQYDEFQSNGHNPRLFEINDNLHYDNEYTGGGEFLYKHNHKFEFDPCVINTGIEIKHFRPSRLALEYKGSDWYQRLSRNISFGTRNAPSETQHFEVWKRYNSRRDEFD